VAGGCKLVSWPLSVRSGSSCARRRRCFPRWAESFRASGPWTAFNVQRAAVGPAVLAAAPCSRRFRPAAPLHCRQVLNLLAPLNDGAWAYITASPCVDSFRHSPVFIAQGLVRAFGPETAHRPSVRCFTRGPSRSRAADSSLYAQGLPVQGQYFWDLFPGAFPVEAGDRGFCRLGRSCPMSIPGGWDPACISRDIRRFRVGRIQKHRAREGRAERSGVRAAKRRFSRRRFTFAPTCNAAIPPESSKMTAGAADAGLPDHVLCARRKVRSGRLR